MFSSLMFIQFNIIGEFFSASSFSSSLVSAICARYSQLSNFWWFCVVSISVDFAIQNSLHLLITLTAALPLLSSHLLWWCLETHEKYNGLDFFTLAFGIWKFRRSMPTSHSRFERCMYIVQHSHTLYSARWRVYATMDGECVCSCVRDVTYV